MSLAVFSALQESLLALAAHQLWLDPILSVGWQVLALCSAASVWPQLHFVMTGLLCPRARRTKVKLVLASIGRVTLPLQQYLGSMSQRKRPEGGQRRSSYGRRTDQNTIIMVYFRINQSQQRRGRLESAVVGRSIHREPDGLVSVDPGGVEPDC